MNIVIASGNLGKIKELQSLLTPYSISLLTQSELGVEEVEETGLTFIENALIKARHAATQTHLPVIADDSGIVVNALKGEPGIFSARYAGIAVNHTKNIELLLKKLSDVPDEKRDAYFYCVLVFLKYPNDPAPLIGIGRWDGTILRSEKGSNGFGYDPIFYLPHLKKTAAELSIADKNNLSHRAQALKALMQELGKNYARSSCS